MRRAIELLAAFFGIMASIAWFLSSRVVIAPAQGSYFDVGDSPDMPFHKAWRKGTMLNQWAAGLTSISVLLGACAELIPP